MISQERADLLKAIDELGARYPNWRLGQLVANIAGWADQELWDIDDEALLHAVRLHLEQAKNAILPTADVSAQSDVSPARSG